jgi:hypothetical protein
MNEITNSAGRRIAELLITEIDVAVTKEEFGVIARDIAPLDAAHLVDCLPALFSKTGKNLRLTLVHEQGSKLVNDFLEKHPNYADYIACDEETAVRWRNESLKTIVVIADGPLSKAASLNTFRQLDEQPLISRLCDIERDKAEVSWLRTLWDALKSKRAPVLSIYALVRFSDSLNLLPNQERSMRAPLALFALGLFPDSHLADEGTEARIVTRLKQNFELLSMIRNANPEDWDRMSSYCRMLSGSNKTKFNAIRKRLKAIDHKSSGGLEELDFTDIQTIWRGRISGSTTTPKPTSDVIKIQVESKAAELLLEGNTDSLSDLVEAVAQQAHAAVDDQNANEEDSLVFQNSSKSVTENVVSVARSDVISLAKSRSTETEWGGVIEIESDRLEALTEVSAFKSWEPFLFNKFRESLAEFVEAKIAPSVCAELTDKMASCRGRLIAHLPELTISPITVLAGRPEVFKSAEDYLDAYDQLLKQLNSSYQEMLSQAMEEAEHLIHWLLAMELYVYRRENVTEVLLSPLHPLNLWRSVAIVRDLQLLGGKISDFEKKTLIEAASEEIHFLNVLLLPKIASFDGQARLLGHAGAVAHLPMFKEAPRGVLEPDGIKSIQSFARLIAHLRPFARPGLQVLLVNAPRPSRFVEEILDALDLDNTTTDDTFWGVHFRLRYTSDDTKGWTSELDEMDDQLKEKIRKGQEKGLITLSVHSEPQKWPEIIAETNELPAHLTVVFDPFEVRTVLVSRAALHDLSPWMPTCEYRYNKLKKQIMVVPVSEEFIFATYLSVATLVHGELRSSTATHQPQVPVIKGWLDQLAKVSTWTVIADPHRVLLPRLGDSEVIDRRTEKSRQITTFGSDLSPFVRRLDQQLKKTHFAADPVTLEQLIRDLVAMEPNGILGLAGGDKSKHIKGALGKLIAMRWYRRLDPSGLAVSLDTQNASRWLSAGGHSNERADLLGLRDEGGELVIDVIEVKAHDEAIPYSIKDGVVRGHAVDQVLSTLHALAEVFGSGSDSPLAKPRREVLREHLFTALLRDIDPVHIERWHGLLQDLFNGSIKVKLAGRIIHVQLASIANSGSNFYQTESGIAIQVETLSATDVGLVLTATKLMHENIIVEGDSVSLDPNMVQTDPAKIYQILTKLSASRQSVSQEATDDTDSNIDSTPDFSPQISRTDVQLEASIPTLGNGTVFQVPEVQTHPVTLEIPLGEEFNSKSLVGWAPGRQSNGFFLILGASGSGKTETLKVIGKGIEDYGVPVLVLDFHGDVVFPGLKSVLMSSGTSSVDGLNPMELDSQSAQETGLYDQRKVIRDMIRNAVPALGHRQNAILRDAIEESYSSAGFIDSDPTTWSNTPPTFAEVETILARWAEDDSKKTQRSAIEGCLAAVQEIFEHPIFHRTQSVSIEEILTSNVRLDLSKLPDEVRYIAAETLLRKIFRVLRLRGPIPVQPLDDRQRFRLFIIIDEAKILSTGGGDPDAPDRILNLLFTEARKFGLGMILASQMSDHFGSEVKANAASWLVLKPMDMKEAKKNAPNVHMDPEALTSLRGRGDGYLRDRTSNRARRIQVNPLSSDS